MIESDNVTDNLVFAVNSLITLYQIRHFYLLAKWRPRSARQHARPHSLQRFRQKWDFCYNWKIKRDLPGSRCLIGILSCHQSGTKESHEMHMRIC